MYKILNVKTTLIYVFALAKVLTSLTAFCL